MPSRKELKKKVNYQCHRVVYECFTFLEHTPSLNQENVQLIISDAVELRNRLIHKINHPPKNDADLNGSVFYYNNIWTELNEQTDNLIDRLNALPR
jgi:hypothetical protein